MDSNTTLPAPKKFQCQGTAREFAHWLDSRSRRQWETESIRRWGFPQYGLPTIERMQDGTPMIVEYHGHRDYTYFDEHLQQDNTASLDFVGVRFVIDPLPDKTVKITAECLHPLFLPLFAELMAELGQTTTPNPPVDNADRGRGEPDTPTAAPEVQREGAALTPKEIEVAECLAQGFTRKEIADKLMIALETVTTHLKNISGKWDMNTTAIADMQREARERGYTPG